MKQALRGVVAGVAASLLAYLLTAVLAVPWLPELFGRIDDVHRETYLAVDPSAWREIAWVLLNAHGMPLALSGPRWMGGGTDLAFGAAPWTLLAGPLACVAVGAVLARNRSDRRPIAASVYLAVGYTLSLLVVAVVTSATVDGYIMEVRPGSAAATAPIVAGVALLSGAFGALLGRRLFDPQ